MDTKTLLQEAKTHLISGKPLVVRTCSNKTHPVRVIQAEAVDLVEVIYENANGCYRKTLYPGSRRFQEMEEQFSSPAPEKLFQYDDEREKNGSSPHQIFKPLSQPLPGHYCDTGEYSLHEVC